MSRAPKIHEKAGRPKADIDWAKIAVYLRAQCSSTAIAEMLGIARDTLYNRCLLDNKVDFTTFCSQKKEEGKEMLRAKQYQTAMEGDKTMLIWLGKQYLEQQDVIKNDTHLTITEMPVINIQYRDKEKSE